MLVKFESSETGEIMMFADIARQLLKLLGKECTARGVFTQAEMLPAAQRLRQAIGEADTAKGDDAADEDQRPLPLARRAWPLIDMLERSAAGGERTNILWQAPQDFGG